MSGPPLLIGGALVNGGLYMVLSRAEAFLSLIRGRLLGGCRAESLERHILGAAEGLGFSSDGVPHHRAPTYLAYLGMVEAAHAALTLCSELPPKTLVGQSSWAYK